MKYIYLVLNWIFGAIFFILGITLLSDYPIPALILFVIAILLLPPIRKFAYEKTGISFPMKVRFITLFILIVVFVILVSNSQREKDRRISEKQAQEEVERLAIINKENISYFNANKTDIIKDIKLEFDKGNYQQVLSKAKKYLVSDDPELKELNKLAKNKLIEIQKKEKAQKILDELNTIPSSNLGKNIQLYNELLSLYPDNSKYKAKLSSYSKKLAEKKEKERIAADRKKRFEKQFSTWDGSHINFTKFIKQSMNDPKSYKHVETVYWDRGNYLIVQTTFRGKNSFGGVVKESVKAKVSLDGDVLEIIE